ncbi:hypothetical protein Dxin01_02512 [Deinococcus xinjiangensis]|uniref:DUF998 domain-containing protein n=1 Tax=Deinococcus xinjiangensis TaxID=457454 RepID=A0ABP9VE02_9DEIO
MNGVAFFAALCYAAALGIFVVLHLQNPHYSPIRHAVSDYAVGPSGRLFSVYNLIGTLGALLVAYLFFASRSPVFPSHIITNILLMVAARVGLLLFKTDLEGEKMTTAGRLHYLFAVLNFAFAYMVIADATPMLSSMTAAWVQILLGAIKVLAAVSLAGVVITLLKPLRRVFGLIERVFLASVMVWFLCASLILALH